jgi:hypothetical protein
MLSQEMTNTTCINCAKFKSKFVTKLFHMQPMLHICIQLPCLTMNFYFFVALINNIILKIKHEMSH